MFVAPTEIASGGAGDRFSKGSTGQTAASQMTAAEGSTLSGAHLGVAVDNSKEVLAQLKRRKLLWDRIASISLAVCGASLCAFILQLLFPSHDGIASVFYFDIRFFGGLLLVAATLGSYGIMKAKKVDHEMQVLRRRPKKPQVH